MSKWIAASGGSRQFYFLREPVMWVEARDNGARATIAFANGDHLEVDQKVQDIMDWIDQAP